MLNSASFLESSRRESRKRRRVSERRRVFGRLGVTSPDSSASLSQNQPRPQRSDSPVSLSGFGGSGDQGKITMKIQFHIVVAPDNEPLVLDGPVDPASIPGASPPAAGAGAGSMGKLELQRQQQKRQFSNESTTNIGEHIHERLSRQGSSTRRRQQLLAMHQQPALLDTQHVSNQQSKHSQDDNNNNLRAHRSGSMSSSTTNGRPLVADHLGPNSTREPGLRSSTISGGMQDEATMNFLTRHQQHRLRQASGSLTSNSASSLVGQHQTLMASNANIRQRLEQREHIYFKRDGQRFGHEFTLKLAVDKNYRCLLKVRPLIPLQAISIQGHHVAFVDCSQSGSQQLSLGAGSNQGASLTRLNSTAAAANTNPSSNAAAAAAANKYNLASQHQSLGGNVPRRGSTVASNTKSPASRCQSGLGVVGTPSPPPPPTPPQRLLNSSQTKQNSDSSSQHQPADQVVAVNNQQQATNNSASLSSLSLTGQQQQNLQQQLLRQQQQHQMMRHFSASHCSSLSSSHSGGQLVYMFDWSAGRFQVNKNKARTQLQTVLKFKNGELLSLPLQVKFYEPECKQHLSWGSQLHFIDYDCQINSMGQIGVDKIHYY